MMELPTRFQRIVKVIEVVLTYWLISVSMVFFNKWLVGGASSESGDTDVSIFVAWSQCIVCVVFIKCSTYVYALCDPAVKKQEVSCSVCLSGQLLWVSLLFSLMLSSNNYCLKYVGIAFFQIARSFTLIYTVIFSALILRQRISWQTVASCLLVVAGFFLGVDQEKAAGTLSWIGVLFGMISSVFVALVGIFTKKALEMEGMDSVKLTLHINMNASVFLLLPTLLTGQATAVVESGRIYQPWFWAATSASGILGFLIAWASTRQIQYTSPITHHISNNTKSILQALLAVLIYHDYKSMLWWFGCCIVLLGAFLYTLIKMKEDQAQREKEQLEKNANANSV